MTPLSAPIPTLGTLELSSIARGLKVCDRMLKRAQVRVLRATPVGCGKFLILVTGREADLLEALEEGRREAAPFLAGWSYLPNVHPQVVDALARRGALSVPLDAVGMLESASLASAVRAADAAAKAAAVRLLELTFDLDLGGKAYLTFTGDLADVEAALDAGERLLVEDGARVNREVIPRPHEDMDGIVAGEGPCCWRG